MATATLSRHQSAASTTSGRCTGSGMKLTRDADAERRGDGVAVQRPQMRVGEPLAEHAQVPFVAPRMDQLREFFD